MSIPVSVGDTIFYLDDVPFGFIDDIANAETKFADRPIGFIAVQFGFTAMKQKKANGWEELE